MQENRGRGCAVREVSFISEFFSVLFMINFQGYREVVENTVYSRDADEVVKTEEGDRVIRVSNLLIVDRYLTPSKDDVVTYLRSKASEASAAASLVLPKGLQLSAQSALEAELRRLPQGVLDDIRRGDERCLEFIRQAIPVPNLRADERSPAYVSIRTGAVPSEILERENFQSADDYHGLISNPGLKRAGYGEELAIRVLANDAVLPSVDEMDVLLRNAVRLSRTLSAVGRGYDPDAVAELVRLLYGVRDDVLKLPDSSSRILEDIALVPVGALYEQVVSSAIAQRVRKQGV